MASKSNNGNLPLGRSKIDASRGVESALSKLSHQVGARTPRQSMTAGSKQLHNGVFMEAPRVRSRSSAAIPNLIIVNGLEAGKYKITNGVVNSETPTLGGVDIGGDPTADPVVPPPEFTVAATTYVWLKCVGVFATPDTHTVTVETSTSNTIPAGTAISATGFTSLYKIGAVEFTAASGSGSASYEIQNQHGGGNLGVDSWGLYNLWWRA